jgi:hypothetical protein
MAGNRREDPCTSTRFLTLVLLAPMALAAGCSVGLGEGLPPTVVYSTPADGSGNVPVTSTVKAVFSTAMDPASIDGSTFTLTQAGLPVAGTVTCAGKTATFTPSANLPGNTVFVATITASARDTKGTAVAANQSWTFMTVAALTATSPALYYTYTFNGGGLTRSSVPANLVNGANTLSQTANPDGSVTLTINNVSGSEDNGFYFYAGTLKYLSTLRVVGTGAFSVNLYLDVDRNGEFFTWDSSNAYAGGGPFDGYYSGPSAVAGVVAVDAATPFTCVFVNNAAGATHTLPELAGGAVAGVNGDTRAAFWIGINPGAGSQTATITSVRPNG